MTIPEGLMSTTTATETSQAEMREDIARRLAAEGMPADARELAAWLASCWPHVEDDPDISRWSQEYRRQFPGENLDAKADLGARQQQQE
jgi:hypothetical protein